MLENSTALGNMQLKRSESSCFERKMNELKLQFNVMRHGTLPVMWYATKYDYRNEVKVFMAGKKMGVIPEFDLKAKL